MPWKESCPMSERRAFIDTWLSKRFRFSQLCARFGVSRKTGYKWVERFMEHGQAGLEPLSRAPRVHPNATEERVVEALLEAKHRYPEWGPVTLVAYLSRERPSWRWPAGSTAGEILKRHGLVKPRGARRARTPSHSQPLGHVEAVHDVWSADFKGDFRLGDARRCYPLTLSDNHSRYLIECKGLYQPKLAPVKACYERAFRVHGLPRAMRTDNGYPFAQCTLGGLTALSVWLLRLGVMPERIAPGHPEQNPRHERMHRTLKAATASPPKANLCAQQRAFNRFRREYNEVRPHRALGGCRCPADLFAPSPRPFPQRIEPVEYPDSFEVRRVRSNGEFKWRGRLVYASSALAGESLGFELVGDEFYCVHFAALKLGLYDARTGRLHRPDAPSRRR